MTLLLFVQLFEIYTNHYVNNNFIDPMECHTVETVLILISYSATPLTVATQQTVISHLPDLIHS